MKYISKLIIVIAFALAPCVGMGQSDGGGRGQSSRGDRNGGGRDGRSRWNRGGGGGDRAARFEGMLRRLDKNGNGMIDADEATGNPFIERMLPRLGVEVKYPIAITQITQAVANNPRSGRNGGGPPRHRPSENAPTAQPGASRSQSGFWQTTRPQTTASGFGQPSAIATTATAAAPSHLTAAASPASPSATTTTTSPADSADKSIDQKIRDLAAAAIQKYDKNGDGKLDRDEWPNGGKLGTFDEANRSGGNFIVADELIVHLTDYYHRQLFPPEVIESGDFAKVLRRSNRFLMPKERLTTDIPDWFRQRDRDGDAQVTMAEFANDWTWQTAHDFDHFDLNHDGVITTAECLKMVKQAALASQAATARN